MTAPEPAPSFEKTWRQADGQAIYDEFGWITDLAYFDGDDEPVELIEETWKRTSVRTVWRFPTPAYCIVEDDKGDPCDAPASAWGRDGPSVDPGIRRDWFPLCADHGDQLRFSDVEIVEVES